MKNESSPSPVLTAIDRFKAVSLEHQRTLRAHESVVSGFPESVRKCIGSDPIPEPYLAIYQDHDAEASAAESDEFDAGDELAGEIRQATGTTVWGFAAFLDERDGRTWVALPPGVGKESHPAMGYPHLPLTMRDGERSWDGLANNLLAFERGEPPIIATCQLAFDGPEVVIEIGLDGTVSISPFRPRPK